jgi:hypothetical protein
MPEHIASTKPSWSHRGGPDRLGPALHNIAGEARHLLASVPNAAATVGQARRCHG